MRKIILLLVSISFLFTSANAAENLSFLYINGSNNNDKKMMEWYEDGVYKLHPSLRKKFLNNKDLKNYYEAKGGLNIKEKPVIFFWGFKSRKDLNYVKAQLEIAKAISSSGSYIVKNLLTKYLHDALWVQKDHNMLPILDDLNKYVKIEANKGNSVVLYGYSAGTFVTYQYLFNKLRYINTEELFKTLNADKDIIKYIQAHPAKNTCISALSADNTGIATLSAQGEIILNPNKEMLKKNYLSLDGYTENVCAPYGKVKGIVNFASPLVLFYSDLADENRELTYFNKLMVKYILEEDMFMLSVNFKEDPLAFPTSRNLTIDEIENRLDMEIVNPTGFIYDNSGVWSRRGFPLAHTSYWSANKVFAKAVVKTLVKGYKFNYNKQYQDKVLKRNSKKSEL